MSAQWIGSKYFRQQDHRWVDRDDKDKKSKSRAVHNVFRTPTARRPVARSIITRKLVPARRL